MNKRKITTWRNYRGSSNLEATLPNALSFYQKRYGHLPPCIRVHPKWAEAAREVAPDGVEIQTNGGTLIGEIWLPQPEEPHQLRMEEKHELSIRC